MVILSSLSLAQVADKKPESELLIVAQVVGRSEAARAAREGLLGLDFRKSIVVRISFQDMDAVSNDLSPHPVDTLGRIIIKLQDRYPDSSRVLYPSKIRRINSYEFYVTWVRFPEFFRELEFVHLVVADYTNLFRPRKQIFSFLKVDLLYKLR